MTLFINLLDEYISFLQIEKGLADNSVQAYKKDIFRYITYLFKEQGLQEPEHIHFKHIEDYIYLLGDLGLSSRTIARNISSLRGFHQYLLSENYCPSDPSEIVDTPNFAKKLPDVLDTEEILAMIDSWDATTPVGDRNGTILETLYGTGMRVSELVHLELSQVLFEIDFIRVIGKGNKERLVPMGGMTSRRLRHFIEHSRLAFLKPETDTKNRIFLNQRGKPLSRMTIWNIVKEAALKARITKDVYPHAFRHSFATHLIEGGADLRAVQEMLGHSSILTTEIYTHIDNQFLRQTFKDFHPRS